MVFKKYLSVVFLIPNTQFLYYYASEFLLIRGSHLSTF